MAAGDWSQPRDPIAWTADTDPLRRGGGPVSKLPSSFEAAPTGGEPESASRGEVAECTARNTGLALAVLLPVPSDSAVVVDGVAVSYEVDGRAYDTIIDATIGVCAADPASSSEQPESCQGWRTRRSDVRDGVRIRCRSTGALVALTCENAPTRARWGASGTHRIENKLLTSHRAGT